MYWLPSFRSTVPPVAVVSIADVGSPRKALHASVLYLTSNTADNDVTIAPLASLSCHFTGYVRPAFPVFTRMGLSIGAKKPMKVYRIWKLAAPELPRWFESPVNA